MKLGVMFVDDETNILKAIRRLFRAEDFDLYTAQSGAEALKLMDEISVQVVVSDHRMPGMTGVDLLATMRERWPEIIRILVTGNSEIGIAVEAINRGEIYRLITKPWNDEEIRATVREALDLHALKGEIKRLNQLTQEQNLQLKDLHQNLEAKVVERTRDLSRKNTEIGIAYIGTLKAVMRAIDMQHRSAANHSERVAHYTGIIARRMGLEESRVRRMHVAALLHDIGKIGIRSEIFSKPGPLTQEEVREVRRHPLVAVEILQGIPWLKDVLPMIRHHHEWFDGDCRGYPDNLKGDAIDLGARIIRVADAIEAMSNDRPFRKAYPLGRVIEELRKCAGTAFDPEVVACALALLEEGGEEYLKSPPNDELFETDRDFDALIAGAAAGG